MGVRCDRRRRQWCACMKAKQQVPALRGGQPGDLASNRGSCDRISLQRASMRRKITLNNPGIWGMSDKSSEAKGGTGFHFHTADVHVVYMVRGWAKFDYDGVDTLVEAGDCVHQRPGIVHNLYDWSDDMEFMEIIMPGDFATTEITPPAAVAPDR